MAKKSKFAVTSKHKRFIVVSIFLLLLILFVITLPYFTKPPAHITSPEKNILQTYRNSTYDLSFTYPGNWKEVPPLTPENGAIVSFEDPNYDKNFRSITLYINQTGYANTLPDFENNFEIANLPAYKQILPAGQNPPQIYVYFTKNGTYYTLQFIDSLENPNSKVFDQLISSIQFSK